MLNMSVIKNQTWISAEPKWWFEKDCDYSVITEVAEAKFVVKVNLVC